MKTADGSPGSSQPDSTYTGPLPMQTIKGSQTPYMITVGLSMSLGVGGIIVVTLFHAGDNTLVIGGMLGFLTSTTLSLMAFLKSQETHLAVNSRLDEFMRNAAFAARAQGQSEGRSEGRAAANDRTDALAATKEDNTRFAAQTPAK